jgi:aspartate/methionine/tyrosine aminotransferase
MLDVQGRKTVLFENQVAQRMSLLHTESAFKILAKAKALEAQGKSVIHLEIGQPDFKTPQNIIDAAYKAMNDGYTGYTPTPGLPEVRQAVAEYAAKHKGIVTDMNEVILVPGGKPIMFYTGSHPAYGRKRFSGGYRGL